jgi:hypothetical protein
MPWDNGVLKQRARTMYICLVMAAASQINIIMIPSILSF